MEIFDPVYLPVIYYSGPRRRRVRLGGLPVCATPALPRAARRQPELLAVGRSPAIVLRCRHLPPPSHHGSSPELGLLPAPLCLCFHLIVQPAISRIGVFSNARRVCKTRLTETILCREVVLRLLSPVLIGTLPLQEECDQWKALHHWPPAACSSINSSLRFSCPHGELHCRFLYRLCTTRGLALCRP